MTDQMQILVVGNGGREHALSWKLSRSPRVSRVWVAPGNGGTASMAAAGRAPISNVPLAVDDFSGLIDFADRESVNLTVVGPEAPLAAGLVDAFQAAGLTCFGPTQAAARLESSKAFAKEFMARRQIPTARYATFTDYQAALDHLQRIDYPVVVKASGLAAGKGVIVPESTAAAAAALQRIMAERAFGPAGDEVVIEERLFGQEASVLAFCDGQTVVTMPPAQDHKPLLDGDHGPNTGGMGAYAPAPLVNTAMLTEITQDVLKPVLAGLRAEGSPYVGILYAGLMVTEAGPRVLEFNCRFGDPETQVILPLLETDLVDVFLACLDGSLAELDVDWQAGAAATVVAASPGYPDSYPKGLPITGLAEAAREPGVVVFHAGTDRVDGERLLTAGGRVLAVTGLGDTLSDALQRAYTGLERIHFEGMHFRRDIGAKTVTK